MNKKTRRREYRARLNEKADTVASCVSRIVQI